MSTTLSSSPFSLQVTSSLWDSSDASGHSGELCLVDALRFLVLFWFFVGGCLVLACLDLVLPLAIDPQQSQESGPSVAGDNLEPSLERRVWPLWGTRSASCYLVPGALLAGSRRWLSGARISGPGSAPRPRHRQPQESGLTVAGIS